MGYFIRVISRVISKGGLTVNENRMIQAPCGRVARFLPRVCANYVIIDTKELEMPGISAEFRGSISHLMMRAVNNRVDAYMELFLRHPLSIRRYYRQFEY